MNIQRVKSFFRKRASNGRLNIQLGISRSERHEGGTRVQVTWFDKDGTAEPLFAIDYDHRDTERLITALQESMKQ